MPATGILGSTTLTVRDLLALEKGDVVKTNIQIDDEVQILLVAVKITRIGTEQASKE